MTKVSKMPWPIPAFADREKNSCPRCRRIVPHDSVPVRPAMLEATSLGLDVATEMESRIEDALEMVSARLSLFINPPHDVFEEVDQIRNRAFQILMKNEDVEKMDGSPFNGPAKFGESVGELFKDRDSVTIEEIQNAIKAFIDSEVAPYLEARLENRQLATGLIAEYEVALKNMKKEALAAWVDMEARLNSAVRLVSRCRDFFDHLVSARTAGDIARAGQQQALTETWNALARELAELDDTVEEDEQVS